MRAFPLICLILLAHRSTPLKGTTLVPSSGHGWNTRDLCTDVCAGPNGELRT